MDTISSSYLRQVHSPFEQYKKFIYQYVPFSLTEWELLQKLSRVERFKKGEIIHLSGSVFEKIYFLNNGLIRAYIIDADTKNFTWNLFFNDKNSEMTNVYVVDYESFVNKSESKITFEVLEDCELISTTYDNLSLFYNESKASERFGRIMAELAYSSVHNSVINKLTKTAQERYEDLIKNSPYLLEKVPQYHIASFLGVTPQSLSRIKKSL